MLKFKNFQELQVEKKFNEYHYQISEYIKPYKCLRNSRGKRYIYRGRKLKFTSCLVRKRKSIHVFSQSVGVLGKGVYVNPEFYARWKYFITKK